MLTTERTGSAFSFNTAAMAPKKSRPQAAFPRDGLLLLGAVARRDALFLGILRRRRLDHRTHDRLIGLDPVGDHVPLLAVPLHELDPAAAFVVHPRDPERRHQAGGAQLLE